jgi:hypothetical protein
MDISGLNSKYSIFLIFSSLEIKETTWTIQFILHTFSCRMEGTGDSPLVDMRTEINGPSEDGKFQVFKGTVSQDFLLQIFFCINHLPRSP